MKPISRVARAVLGGLLAAAAGIGCAQILGTRFDDATLDGGATAPPGDASPGADAPDAQAFDPRRLEHLELWLAADFGVTETGVGAGGTADADGLGLDGVALWEDRSGKGHSAVGSDALRRPHSVHDAGAAPVIAFDRGQGTCLSDTWANGGVPMGLTLFVVSQGDATNVVRFESLGAIGFPWNSNYAGAPGDEPRLHLLVATATGARETPLLGSQGRAWEVLSARLVAREVGGLRTYRNGELSEQASLTGEDLPSLDALTIGCAGMVDEFATAFVGEVLVYTAALSDGDRHLVEEYLRIKWQIH